ncbi:MAG: hypothetical protein KAG43_04340 [Candidatus Marithrix sp.]|nr:hypothetical protein [Candidatus Marithrix sp.]
MRTKLTKEAVENAIIILEQQNIYPSLEKIRKITGGSSKRISELRKELEHPLTPKNKTSYSEPKIIPQDTLSRIELRMMQMEMLFSQRFADIDAKFALKNDTTNKQNIIAKLQAENKVLKSKNTLLINQLNQELARVKELSKLLQQAKTTELEKKSPVNIEYFAEKDDKTDTKQKVIQQFDILIEAQWDEKQNAEIALQKIARQWLMEKWPEDSYLLDNAVLDTSINNKRYVIVSISKESKMEQPYIIHCIIFQSNTEELVKQRKSYAKAKSAHDKAHKLLNG